MSTTAFEMYFSAGTTDQYDQVLEKMGFENGVGPEHALFHWAAPVEGGLKVVDVWDSPEAFQQFAEAAIIPFTQEIGLAEPQITTFNVHNTLVGPDVLAASRA